MKYLIPILFLLLISCESQVDKLKKEGYQILENKKVAIQCPCKLKRDKKVEKEYLKYKNLTIYSCFYYNSITESNDRYMVHLLKNKKKQSAGDIERDLIQLIHTLRPEVEESVRKLNNGEQAVLLKHSSGFWDEVILTEDYTYYLMIQGWDFEKEFEKFSSSLVILE